MRSLFSMILLAATVACGGAEPAPAGKPADKAEASAKAPAAQAPKVEAAKADAPKADPFPEIPLDELKGLVEGKKVVLLDANGAASYKEGHIPGAIDFDGQKDKLASLLPADKGALIVAYCGGPTCNAWKDAAAAVASMGYTQVRHFKGGISGWKAANAPVEM